MRVIKTAMCPMALLRSVIRHRAVAWIIVTLPLVSYLPQVMAANTFEGEKSYQLNCAMCHGKKGRPQMPSAANFQRGDGMFQSDITLARRIETGKNACPSFYGVLTKQQIFNVIAYIRTLL